MNNPKVTVLMPVYNGEQYLNEAIDSVLNQTFTDFEFLIINDGSSDKSREIILSYNDERIRLVDNPENLKLIATLNKGIELANGEYIARMDADDIMLPERLAIQVNFMNKNEDVAVCGSWIKYFGAKNYIRKYKKTDKDICENMILASPIAHPTAIIRKKTLTKNKIKYRKEYIHAEDYYFWYEISKHGKLANIQQVLLNYRSTAEQITNKYAPIQIETTKAIRRKIINDNTNNLLKSTTEISTKIIKNITKNRYSHFFSYTLYMSLNKYNFKSLFYFIFSKDFWSFKFGLKKNIKIKLLNIF